jgi:uncharacterized protein (TIGR03084 family)
VSILQDILSDLAAEGDELDDLVAPLTDEGWQTPTPAAGWDIAHQVAHLAWTDEAAILAATDKTAWDALVMRALEDPAGFVDTAAAEGAGPAPEELLARWRSSRTTLAKTLIDLPEGQKLPWFGPPMSAPSMATARFMETWAHGLDVADALGVRREPTDRIRHVVHLGVRTRDFSFGAHELAPPAEPFRVELTMPSRETWTHGPDDPGDSPQRVTGSAYDFAQLVTQRINRDDTDLVATGPDAEKWLSIAQAFAGPPGEGRAAS